MTDFFVRNRAGFIMIFVATLAFSALVLRVDPYVQGVKTSVWYLISPEVVYTGKFFNTLDSLKGRVFHLVRVGGENFILRKQNAELAKGILERDALESENNRLRELLNLKNRRFPDGIAAEVINRDTRDWFHAVILNKGSEDGIVFSAAVVAGMTDRPALIGRVMEVYPRSSKVLLITDAISAISVAVQGRGDIGLLEGRNQSWVSLNYLSPSSNVAPGDKVVTVGLGGIFPPGIPVGEVANVTLTPDGYFKTAQVIPPDELNSLRDVLVLRRDEMVPEVIAKK